MPPAQLTPKQQQFLEDYKRKHSIIYPKKVSESELFLRRKGKVLDALEAVPKFAAQSLRQSMLAADLLADQGDFEEAHKALEQVKVDALQLAASYDPTNDLQTIDQDLQSHLKNAKGATAEATAASLTHRDAAASTAEEQATIDRLLKKTIVFLTSADQELKDISFRLSEVTRCCKLPAHQQQATALATTLQAGMAAASVIMKSPQKYWSPDEARNSLTAARDQKLKELDSYNQRKDQVLAVIQKFPQWRVTTKIQQSRDDAEKAAKNRDYVTAFNSSQTALTDATILANSYQPAADLKQLDAELTTFLEKAKAAAAEVAKVREEHKPGGHVAELALIDPKIPLATAFLPNAGSDHKRLSEQLNELFNRFCKSPSDVHYASTLIYNLRTGMQEIGPLLKPSGEFYTLPELRLSLVAIKPAPAVAAKLVAEASADTKALASAARIHQVVAQGAAAVPQMTIVPRANIAANLHNALAAIATGPIPRNQMLKSAATAASQVLQQMLQGTNTQAERIDLMLLIATDDLDGLLTNSMPGVNWGTDPKLLGELADATRKDLANVITNRIVVQGNQETAQIGGESYEFKEELGRGGLGIAKLFESKKDKSKQLVLKEPQTRASSNIPPDIQYQMVMASNREMANELRAHLQASQSNHPNVLKLQDLCIGPDGRVRAVMEVAAGGDVQKLHRSLEALSDLDVLPQAARAAVERDIAAQMLSGIAAMHGAGLVHHDLKGDNVLLKADGTVQVADFGSGIAMTAQGKTPQVTRTLGTTMEYAPPKSHPEAEHDEAFDIFTVGKILERDVGTPGKPGSTASSADRLREALTRSDADKRADLEAAAKTAYIAEVDDFRNMPEYKDLLKEVMAARSTAVGKFLKARSRLVHSLDVCRCEELGQAMNPISHLAAGVKYNELTDIYAKIRNTTEDYYKAVIRDISLSAKDFSGTVDEAGAAGQMWIAKLQKYATQLPVELAKHKNLMKQFESKYQDVLRSVDWDAVRTAMGGSKVADKDKQQAIKGLAKAEMRVYGILDAFDEVAPRIAELVQAIGALPQAKSGELRTIREAGRKFVAAQV
jgi:serine/threonine protein kinase